MDKYFTIKNAFWRYFHPFIMGPYVIGVLLVFLWPTNMCNDCKFFSWIRYLVPSISGYEKHSNFSNTSLAYFSISALIYLPCFLMFLKNHWFFWGSPAAFDEFVSNIKSQNYSLLFCIVGILFCSFLIIISLLQPGYQIKAFPINSEKWALAFFGPLFGFFSFSYIMLGLIFSYFVIILRIFKGGE